MKRNNLMAGGVIVSLSVFLFAGVASAQENVQALKDQISELQKRIEVLESTQSGKNDTPATVRTQRNLWDPFAEMAWIQEEMNRMFQSSFSRRTGQDDKFFSDPMNFQTGLDIKETKEGYEVTFDMKGLDKDKVNLEINPGSLTVQGEHASQDVEEGKNGYFHAQSFGSFSKTIPLPDDADTNRVTTERNGDALVVKILKKKGFFLN